MQVIMRSFFSMVFLLFLLFLRLKSSKCQHVIEENRVSIIFLEKIICFLFQIFCFLFELKKKIK